MYIQSAWTHNIAEGVFTDPPVSYGVTIMYIIAFILLSSRLWKSNSCSKNMVFPRIIPVK